MKRNYITFVVKMQEKKTSLDIAFDHPYKNIYS